MLFIQTIGLIQLMWLQVSRLQLEGSNLQSSTSYAQIQVSDTGKGINPDFLPHVFDYFRQEKGEAIAHSFPAIGRG